MKLDKIKLHAFWNSLATNVASPFVGFDLTAAGASDVLIGYVQAIGTLASAVTQLFGGILADRSGRRVGIAVAFSLAAGVLWLLTALLQAPDYVAIAFTAITLVLGFYAAGWTAMIGEGSEGTSRGAFLGSYARLISTGALVALLLTTAVTAVYPSSAALYALSGGFFVVSALVLKGQREQKVERVQISSAGALKLRNYYLVTGVYGLFWGFAWPLFTITLVRIVNMSLFEYSITQVIATASTIGFQPLIGRLVDRDRKKWVFWGRMGLVIYPLAYMVLGAPWEYYVLNILSGLTNAVLNIAFSAYLYDISPTGQRGRHSAEFNLVTGVSTMAGSLFGGYLLSAISTPTTLWISLAYLYLVAAGGRAFAAILHLGLPREGGPPAV